MPKEHSGALRQHIGVRLLVRRIVERAMKVAEEIRRRLVAGLAPARLEVIDESAAHAGHSGARPGGETHFRVVAVAEIFEGKGRLARHRIVQDLLADLLSGQIHALSLVLRTSGENEAASREGPNGV